MSSERSYGTSHSRSDTYGADPEERKRLQAEIDAAAFHAYGLSSDETRFVCEDFHRVQNPRLMTDDYFESVVEKYDELSEKGPQP